MPSPARSRSTTTWARLPCPLVLLCLLLAPGTLSCALTAPALATPAHGGGAWRALRSPHFALTTDLPRSSAVEALAVLEGIYEMFVTIAFRDERTWRGHIDVVLFRREKDYRALAPAGTDAYFSADLDNDPEPQPTAVMFGEVSRDNRRVFQHELTHHFMRRWLPHLPTWLNEGTAEYFSTMHVEGGEVLLGAPLPGLVFTTADDWQYVPPGSSYYAIPAGAVPTPTELLAATPELFYAAQHAAGQEPSVDEQRRQRAFYAGAWALVHLLRSDPGYRRSLQAFVDALGRGARPDDALASSFGAVSEAALTRDFEASLRATRVPVQARPYRGTAGPPTFSEQGLADAEVHVLFARLTRWHGDGLTRAREHLDEALASAPASRDVHLFRALLFAATARDHAAEAEIAAALADHPEDPVLLLTRLRIEMLRLTLHSASPAALEAFSTRLAKVATTAVELDAVARARSVLGRADDALPFAERAIRTEPDCWRCQDTYAILLAAEGRSDEAVSAEARALELLPERSWEGPALFARLQKLRAAARAKAAAPPVGDAPARPPP